MRQPSNVRCYLPKAEAAKLLTVFQQIPAGGYDGLDDFARSIDEAYAAIRERMASGGPGWTPK